MDKTSSSPYPQEPSLSLLLRLRRQIPLLWTLVLTVLLPIAVVYAVVGLQHVVPFAILLRDANATSYDVNRGVMFYRGALSNVGILLWWGAVSIYAFAAYVLRSKALESGFRRMYLVYMALFTGLLALDDLFMIHEEVLPNRLGVPEVIMYALYGALAAGLIWFIPILLETDFLILGLAFGFFALSLLTDVGLLQQFFRLPAGFSLLAEDLAKMLGIVCWLVFSFRTARQMLMRYINA